jgi:hypothetical protein
VYLLVPAAVIALLWMPLLTRYSFAGTPVTDAMVEAGRTAPSDAILLELRDFSLFPIVGRGRDMEVAVAEKLLQGSLELPGWAAAPIGLPFSPDDLDGLPSALQLWFARYGVPDFLLAAYVDTQRDAFLAMARDTILAWDRYERSARLPRGYLWNDDATAARAQVLAEFWRIYRQRPDYRPEVGRVVLEQAARYRAFLSDPGQFTFATNHGLMENLGLLELELAFPTLPDGASHRQLALERIGRQLTFLVGEDGVVRENSAGYQRFGLELLAMTFRCMTLLGEPVPAAWSQRYERGLAFLRSLERPDRTLPASGDTDEAPEGSPVRVTAVDGSGSSGVVHAGEGQGPDQELSVHPSAGYWIEWAGSESWPDPAGMSQTVVTWTRPPAPSHEHADEPSVLVWAKGISWLTGVGYWPYGEPGRAGAESWPGANAPHLADEAPDSQRTASLLAYGSTPGLSAVDLERRGPGAYLARRQVVHLKPDLWVILDHVESDAAADNETVWTLGPGLNARRDPSADSWSLESSDGASTGWLAVLGSPGTVARDYRGSRTPFAGWNVVRSVPRPAPAIVVEQPGGDAWTVVVLSLADASGPLSSTGGGPQVSAGSTADGWVITLPVASGQLRLTRTGDEITVDQPADAGPATISARLAPAPDTKADIASARAAFDRVAEAYPQFQERSSARTRLTAVLLGLVLVQEAVLLGVRRVRPRLLAPLRLLSLVCWIGVGVAVNLVVLRSWEVVSLT